MEGMGSDSRSCAMLPALDHAQEDFKGAQVQLQVQLSSHIQEVVGISTNKANSSGAIRIS